MLEEFLSRFKGLGWIEIGDLSREDWNTLQETILKYEPKLLIAKGLRLSVRTSLRGNTVHPQQFIKGQDGTAYALFQVV